VGISSDLWGTRVEGFMKTVSSSDSSPHIKCARITETRDSMYNEPSCYDVEVCEFKTLSVKFPILRELDLST
jgi:hypothetical protein